MSRELDIFVKNDVAVTSSRNVAYVFGRKHKHVLDTIRTVIARDPDKAASRFIESRYVNGRNKVYPEYLVTQDGFVQLAFFLRGAMAEEVVEKYIQQFNAMQASIKRSSNVPQIDFNDKVSVAKYFREACDNYIESESQRAALEIKVTEYEPKVQFADAILASDTDIYIGDLAKILNQNGIDTGRTRFFDWLRENGWLMKVKYNKNLPTQKAMNLGLFRIKETIRGVDSFGRPVVYKTTMATTKGQKFFINKLLNDTNALQLVINTDSTESNIIDATIITESEVMESKYKERIEKYLKMPLPDAWENFSIDERRIYTETYLDATDMVGNVRERVCNTEIWCECFGGGLEESKAKSHMIAKIMKSIPGWTKAGQKPKYVKCYGLQKSYVLVK